MVDFRKQLRKVTEDDPAAWEASRRLVTPACVRDTIRRIRIGLSSAAVEPSLREQILAVLQPAETAGLQGIAGEALRALTGQNPTKAIRLLGVFLGLTMPDLQTRVSQVSPGEIEAAIAGKSSPYDLLLKADVASLVDFGAGDLTFEEHLVKQYLPRMHEAGKDLIVHSLDRLGAAEDSGSLVRAGRDRLAWLEQQPCPPLYFRFFSDQDMFAIHELKTICPRYTIAVCHSPASPTFAYENTRLSAQAIQQHLSRTKGEFRQTKRGGRHVLEVRHGEEWLTFPPWKFDIYGPLALLDLLSRSGKLCVLGGVDMEVFWEILSQLLPDDRARPPEVFFTADNAREFFGSPYEALARLKVGDSMVLTPVRPNIPRVLDKEPGQAETYSFRYVEIRRGALFSGVPAGKTAYVFGQMTQEAAPWCITLVPSV